MRLFCFAMWLNAINEEHGQENEEHCQRCPVVKAPGL